jgi:hypothetical protein
MPRPTMLSAFGALGGEGRNFIVGDLRRQRARVACESKNKLTGGPPEAQFPRT